MKFTVEVFGDRALDMFKGIATRTESRTTLDMLGEVLTEYESVLFHTGNRGKWRKDSATTIALKGSSRVLIDSGDLMRSLTSKATIERDAVSLFAKEPYAKYVKKGRPPRKNHKGQYVGRKVPGRNPAPRPPRPVMEQWKRLLLEYMTEGRR